MFQKNEKFDPKKMIEERGKRMEIQVQKEHYNFLDYVDAHRWSSYYCQLEEILQTKAAKVLLIGVGDGLTVQILKDIAPDISVETFDFDKELHPDITGDVRNLSKHTDATYDAIVCCQVLEHLEFSEFDNVLKEISRKLRRGGTAVISLPDSGVGVRIQVKLPKMNINYSRSLCRFWKRDFIFNGEHYWEINSAVKYKCSRIRKIIEGYFCIKNEYLVPNNPYHRFFRCIKL